MEKFILHIDFKLKLYCITFQAKTTDLYGKKSMSWSGAVLVLKKSNDEGLVCGKKGDAAAL